MATKKETQTKTSASRGTTKAAPAPAKSAKPATKAVSAAAKPKAKPAATAKATKKPTVVEKVQKAAKAVATKVSKVVKATTAGKSAKAKSAEKPKATPAKQASAAGAKAAPAPKKTASKAAPTAAKATSKVAAAKTAVKKAAPAAVKTAKAPAKPKVSRAKKSGNGADQVIGIMPEEKITAVSPTDAREHYFQEHRPGASISYDRELPLEYGDTRITVLVRDPEWVYAFWEVNDATRQELKIPRNGHNRRMVVRMYQVSNRKWPEENANYFYDIDISPYANNWYVKVPETDKQWCAELGMFDETGAYIPICRSNVVMTPRDTISEEVDSEWMSVEESFEKIYTASGGESLRNLRTMRGSEAILRQLQKQIVGVLRGEGLHSGALSSGAVGGGLVEAGKSFWLQVHTELILYGATEPNATVTVQGRPVRLNSDGSFTLRFALPDGEQILAVRAVNSDGDMEREIVPVVRKSTRS